MPHRPSGFTLIEAVIALAVVSVLVCFAVPAWSGALEATHASSARMALTDSMLHSVTQAIAAGSEVVLCPGDAGGCRASIDWSGGWIAYADIDGNRQRGSNETLLDSQPALSGKVHLRSTAGRTRLVFQPNGSNAGSNVTFTLCDGRGAGSAISLVLANNGRLRAGKPMASAARSCISPMQ